jgi:uncharacterized protein (TIGR03437 family)
LGFFAMALSIQAQTPTVSSVKNGASYSALVSPGAFVAIFGANFGGTLADTSVTVGGFNAPVYFVSSSQINVQFPFDLRPGPTTLIVTVRDVVSAPVHLNISAYAPALLTTNASGTGIGVFTSAEEPSTPVSAARPGQAVAAYAVGLGAEDAASPKVTVGGIDAGVSFAGLASGQTAVYRVVFVVPPVGPGNRDVAISIGGVTSPAVTLPIAPRPATHGQRLNPAPGRVLRLPISVRSEASPAVSSGITYTCNSNISTTICNTLNSTIAGLYSSAFTNAGASIYITFGNTGLGESLTGTNDLSYSSFRNALIANETDANDATAVANSVPATNPYGNDTVSLPNANMRALGFSTSFGVTTSGNSCTLGGSGCYDGMITISSAENTAGNLYFRTGPPITGNQYDFYTIVEHETDEVLATASCLLECSGAIAPPDLYRYHSSGTRSFAAGNNNSCSSSNTANACFSIDGVTMLQQYNNLDNGDDFGDWVSNCNTPLVQDAVGCPGVADIDISPSAEILVLDVVGFTLTGAKGVPDLTITKTHTGNFTQGQTGASYAIVATNSGTASTSGTATVSEMLPAGLTATSMTGTGWSCTQPAGPCTRSDVLTAGNSYAAITLIVNVAGNAPASITNQATVAGGGESNTGNDTASDPTTILSSALPDLTITKTHNGNFTQGQAGGSYTITVTNSGTASTSGAVTVTDTLPAGLTATAITGSGWGCTQPVGPCTRSDVLTAGNSYAAITLTVNVANNAPASVTNQVTVSGGGESNAGNDTASDVTTIVTAPPALTITKTHNGNFTQGQAGVTYTITVANSGKGPTSGAVTVTETPPSGLTLVSIAGSGSGSGWSCAANSCTRSDSLAAGLSYPAIIATVNVAANASSPQVNSVSVSGGGSASASASDSTTIVSNPPILSIAKTHNGSFIQGQLNALYSLVVSNQAGAGPTSGLVTVTEMPPSGLTLVSMAGTGWTCTGTTCTRSDMLNGGSPYPAITVTVNVALTASSPQVNQASVSGGGTAVAKTIADSTVIAAGGAGTLSATPSNGSTFTYILGTTPPSLPLGIASNPTGVAFSVAPSANLGSSVMNGTTPSTASVSVNPAAVTTPGTQSGTVTVSVLNSALNCASPVIMAGQSVCTAAAPFTINVQPAFFQGETAAGDGFFNLTFFGTYDFASYSPLTIYHTTLGFEGIFTTTDVSRGIYLYDDASGHVWYTNPALFPNIYDFNVNAWLYYFGGNATKGGRSFYNFSGPSAAAGFTTPGFIFL